MNRNHLWKIITAVELVIAATVILLDLFIPTLVILGIMALSLLVRRESLATLGFKRPLSWPRLAGFALVSVFLLQLFDIGVVMPILNRLTGTTIDYSGFASLQGNLGQLLFILAVSWILAALGEEIVFRGYLLTRLGDLFGHSSVGIWLSVVISSLLFGLIHTEQGVIGMVVTTIDGLFYSWLKHKFDNNLWVSILAHGFYNSIGMIVFYFTGPIYGLW